MDYTKDYEIGDLVEIQKGYICEYLGGGFNLGLSVCHLYMPISSGKLYFTLEKGRVINGKCVGECIPFGSKINVGKVYKLSKNKKKNIYDNRKAGELISIKVHLMLYLGKEKT